LSSSKGLPSLSFTVPAGDTSTSPSGVSTLWLALLAPFVGTTGFGLLWAWLSV
jgi:hypothetical protein